MEEESQEEVIALEIDLDGRKIEFLLTDIQEILGSRYAALFSDDPFLLDEDRTIFAKIETIDGEDTFQVLTDPIELEMVISNTTLDVVEDMLLGVRSEIRQISQQVMSIDPALVPDTVRASLGIIYSKAQGLLEMLEDAPDVPEDPESEE